MLTSNMCPVCGFELWFLPWSDECPSDEMCPCCGIQFGLDDVIDLDDVSLSTRMTYYAQVRSRWIDGGMLWRGSVTNKPKNWDPRKQLRIASFPD